ncbi:MAG: GNAT family N-acetyltransferase [Rubellimicrobium sp.]|nr:GNAT family N-acetyltransferase [Rubellimicrobium sp.]
MTVAAIRRWTAPVSGPCRDLAGALQAQVPVIETARTLLRAPALGDFAAWAEIALGPRGRFLEIEDADEAWDDFCRGVAVWALRGHGWWTVDDRAGGGVLGFVLIGFEPGDEMPELGFLFREGAEGRGLAFEAAAAARDHAFGAMGIEDLASYTDPANDRAARLALRLGGQEVAGPGGARAFHYHPTTGGRA